jgi:hypothetical protein
MVEMTRWPEIPFHGARSTFATLVLAHGPPRAVTEKLGRFQIALPMDTSCHGIHQRQGDAAPKLGALRPKASACHPGGAMSG